jgi:hypothetical protein
VAWFGAARTALWERYSDFRLVSATCHSATASMFRRVRLTFCVRALSGRVPGTPLRLRSFQARIYVRTVAAGPSSEIPSRMKPLLLPASHLLQPQKLHQDFLIF